MTYQNSAANVSPIHSFTSRILLISWQKQKLARFRQAICSPLSKQTPLPYLHTQSSFHTRLSTKTKPNNLYCRVETPLQILLQYKDLEQKPNKFYESSRTSAPWEPTSWKQEPLPTSSCARQQLSHPVIFPNKMAIPIVESSHITSPPIPKQTNFEDHYSMRSSAPRDLHSFHSSRLKDADMVLITTRSHKETNCKSLTVYIILNSILRHATGRLAISLHFTKLQIFHTLWIDSDFNFASR